MAPHATNIQSNRTALAAAALAVSVLVAVTIAAGGFARAVKVAEPTVTHAVTFPDTTPGDGQANGSGDPASAPDITRVSLSNTHSRLITFKIRIPGSPALVPGMEVWVALDSDKNAATGSDGGYEYKLGMWVDSTGNLTSGVWKWNTSDTSFHLLTAAPGSFLASYTRARARFVIGSSDLGGTKVFAFFAQAYSGVSYDSAGNSIYTNASYDLAPDTGSYAYRVIVSLPASLARLQGAFAASERVLKSTIPGISRSRKAAHERWSLRPVCSNGPCAVRAAIPNYGTFRLDYKRSSYSTIDFAPLACKAAEAEAGVTTWVSLHPKSGTWIDDIWRVKGWKGTVRIKLQSCTHGAYFATVRAQGKLKSAEQARP